MEPSRFVCVEEWDKITPEQCIRLVSLYRRPLEAVITNKGFLRSIKSISVSVFNTFSLGHSILLHRTNFWTNLYCFLYMYGLLGLLPTSGENFMSTAPLEIYLMRKMMTSILILPAIYIYIYIYMYICPMCIWEKHSFHNDISPILNSYYPMRD